MNPGAAGLGQRWYVLATLQPQTCGDDHAGLLGKKCSSNTCFCRETVAHVRRLLLPQIIDLGCVLHHVLISIKQ